MRLKQFILSCRPVSQVRSKMTFVANSSLEIFFGKCRTKTRRNARIRFSTRSHDFRKWCQPVFGRKKNSPPAPNKDLRSWWDQFWFDSDTNEQKGPNLCHRWAQTKSNLVFTSQDSNKMFCFQFYLEIKLEIARLTGDEQPYQPPC